MQPTPTFQKVKSLVTLTAFLYSLFTPLFQTAFAVPPTVSLYYSANPSGTGTLTITAAYSESVVGTPLISIDQPGSTDIVEVAMMDQGTGGTWTYDYTVNVDNGSSYIDGTANVSLTGAYNGIGEIADPASNASFDIVTDIVAPAVTLVGSTPLVVFSGGTFTDDGANWTDNVDGSGNIPTYNSGSVDVNNTGSYTVSYIYVDGAGNTGSVDRVVNVVEADVTAPVVTLSGSSPIEVEFGGPFIDDGANWTDNVDGSGNIPAYNSGSIDVGILSSFVVTYFYVDVAGNTGSVDRVVNIVDTTAPVVTLSGSSPVTIFSGGIFTDEGANWTDAVDGSGNIGAYNSGTLDVNNSGSYLISYVYVDVAGNTGSVDRVVNVVEPDVTAPVVTLRGSSPMDVESATSFIDPGANWSDNVDGSDFIGSYNSGTLDINTPGTYTVGYVYVDAAGNTGSADRTVNIIDTTAPVVTLSGSTPVSVLSGSTFVDDGANWTDAVDGSGNIGSYNSGSVDTFTAGSYTVSYVYVDGAGNTGSVDRVVNVVDPDLTAPVVTLNGSSPVDVEYGGSFVDDGASWTDNVDGSGNIGAYNSGTLDTNTLGTYTVGYVYVDVAGNTGSVERVINVVDTTAPVVTLSGTSPVIVLSGSSFVDEGANWSDAVDGSGNIPAYNSGSVDVNNTGSYTVSYIYVDGAGNTGSVDRVVNVVDPDFTAPVVTLNGSSPVDVEFGSSYSDAGASWTDNVDGGDSVLVGTYGGTGSFTASGSVNTNTLGTYIVEYAKVDSSGNFGNAFRTVNVVDTTAPVVTLSGTSPVNMITGGAFSDEGANWTDAVDGSGNIGAYNSGTLDVNNSGSYLISYVYVDGAGNTGSVDRVVNVVDPDLTAPVVTLNGSSPVDVEYGGSFVDDGASWTDNVDGSGNIGSYNSGSVDTNTLGTYTVGYVYVDVAGNTGSVERVINVVDTTAPVVSLVGVSPETLLVGGSYSDAGASWTDNVDGSGNIPTYNSGSVDVNNTGSYTVSYIYVDGAGNTGSVDRVVNVVEPDSVPPTVTLYGSSSVNTEYGLSYTDAGAYWVDNLDGGDNTLVGVYGGTGSFTLSGTVDTNTLGSYMLEYSKVDSSGNSGNTFRTVTVVDTTAPVITLLGSDPESVVVGGVFTDNGATWSDLHDGTGAIVIATSGSVDVNTIGSYILEYSQADISGNTGTTTRTVNVTSALDTTPPVVTRIGSGVVNIQVGSPFVDAGATWSDNVDGTGVISAYNSGSVNTSVLGTYLVGYVHVDVAGNTGSVSRTINVIDGIAPTASVSYAPLTTTSGSVIATLTGASESITIINNGGNANYTFTNNGTFTFIFIDGAGNTGTTLATVSNIDTTAPVITITGGTPTSVTLGSTYIDAGATALDAVSGNVTSSITTSGSVNTSMTGSYTIQYTAVDGVGNRSTATRTVTVGPAVISTPSSGGGGGGASAGSYVAYFSAPNSTPIGSSSLGIFGSDNLSLGILRLQNMLESGEQNVAINDDVIISDYPQVQDSQTESLENDDGAIRREFSLIFDPIVTDIDNHASSEAIMYLVRAGIVNNTQKFDPERNMTRAEFVKILTGFYEMGSVDGVTLPYSDTSSSDLEAYLKYAYTQGWISSQERFRPNDPITLGEAKTLLLRTEGVESQTNLFTSEGSKVSRGDGAQMLVEWMNQ